VSEQRCKSSGNIFQAAGSEKLNPHYPNLVLVQRLTYLAVAERRPDRRLAEVTDWTASVKYWRAVPKCTWCMSRHNLYWILYTFYPGSINHVRRSINQSIHQLIDQFRVQSVTHIRSRISWIWGPTSHQVTGWMHNSRCKLWSNFWRTVLWGTGVRGMMR